MSQTTLLWFRSRQSWQDRKEECNGTRACALPSNSLKADGDVTEVREWDPAWKPAFRSIDHDFHWALKTESKGKHQSCRGGGPGRWFIWGQTRLNLRVQSLLSDDLWRIQSSRFQTIVNTVNISCMSFPDLKKNINTKIWVRTPVARKSGYARYTWNMPLLYAWL